MDNIILKKIRNIEESGTIMKHLTIFVGKNGMGKSSLMRLFSIDKAKCGSFKKKDHCFGVVRKVLTLVILGQ